MEAASAWASMPSGPEAAPAAADAADEEPPEDFFKHAPKPGGMRASVSAEAYGDWNKKQVFEPPKYPKDAAQKERLAGILEKSFMFASLEPADMDVIIMAMQETISEPGSKIIEQGDDGEFLFVIEQGSPECKILK